MRYLGVANCGMVRPGVAHWRTICVLFVFYLRWDKKPLKMKNNGNRPTGKHWKIMEILVNIGATEAIKSKLEILLIL